MASTYSDLGLELMETGENAGTWGGKTNSNLNLIQQSVAGYEAVALTDAGTVTLAMTDATLSNARNMVIKFTGTLTTASTVTIPDGIEKFYIFDCSAVVGPTNLTIKTVSGTGFTLNAAKIFAAYSDGTNLNEISLDTLGGTIAAADITGTISTAQIADNAVTTAKISDNQITTAKISDNQITTAKVSDLQITTAKIADDSITPDKLSNTAVTAGAYTTADITVDAQGRITAAASGSAAGGLDVVKLVVSNGGATGTFTANPAANNASAFIKGGGGGGGGMTNNPGNGQPGGKGGFGYFFAPVTGGAGYTYAVGNSGIGGEGSYYPGNAGNATNVTDIGTSNGGAGGGGGTPGSAAQGSAPGSTGDFTGETVILGNAGIGGNGGSYGMARTGNSGTAGFIMVYDNSGV